MADFSLPVPPKDDFHLMMSKDFPISGTLGSSIDLSNPISFGFKEAMSEPLTLNTNSTFSGAKRASKISTAQLSSNIDSTLLDTKASEVENEHQKITHPDKMSTKPWWLSLGRLKSKKHAHNDSRIKVTVDTDSNPASNTTLSASIISTSTPTSLNIDPMINDGNNNVQNLSKVKKLNIRSKLQKFGHKKTKINESSNMVAEEHLTQTTGLSTMSTGKPESDRRNIGTFAERLNRSHSFTSDHRPTESPLEQTEKQASLMNPPKTVQEMIAKGQDFMISSLFPNEYLNQPSSETCNDESEDVKNIVAPLRHSTGDALKSTSLTTRRSRIFDIFTSKNSSQRMSRISLSSSKSLANLNGKDPKTLVRESSVSRDPTSFVNSNNYSHQSLNVDVENMDTSFGKHTESTDEQNKVDKSPLRLFKKRFYQNFLPSHTLDTKSNVIPVVNENKQSTIKAINIENLLLSTAFDEGDVSISKLQAINPSLYASSLSSFSKSFNSEDPSAFRTISDSQPFNFNETNFSKPELPLEDVWDVLINPQTTDKGPARLSNNRLSYIPDNFFNKLFNLKELYLDRNTLRDLPEELLKLTKLEILDLSNNCISEFNPRLKFKRLKNLKRLNLDNNVLSDIVSICKLKKLRELRANNNLLVSLTDDISKLSKLRLLYLDNNQLTSLPDSIGKLKSLCVLRLNNNNIESLPSAICSLRQLQVLELRANLLTQLPENIKELESLAKLNVSNNRLTSLPNDIVRCSRLTHLIASNNQLESIPSKIGQLYRLLTLNLRENLINNLPTDLGRLVNLIDLDLSYNELIVLPEDIGNLKKLTEIKLNNNPSLLAIPETFRRLSQIKKIHLQHCNLSSIPFEIGDAYSQLEYVNLSFNLFDAVPSLHGMYRTTIFNISNNRIGDLTEQIGQLESLCELYVVNNKLTHLPKSIGRLKNLEILDVSENMLVGLPSSIGDCHSLRELRLRGNSLENLPMTLGRLKNLNVFYIGQWPRTEFNIIKGENHYENLKMNPYQHKIPLSVERTLLWRMHDSILKRLRDIDYNDGTSERSLISPSDESNHSQDGGSHTSTPDPSSNYTSPPIPRDDVILKMAVLKGVYDQIMKDMRSNDYDKELCGDDTTEFTDSVKKKKFSKLKEFKFLKINDSK
ncbi:38738_t:CDS:2 [Gigaspora margarita]|uniref:38738_t:CDS:1 n=1 Tax=Gigaspora margarita TaxID=4874 RepID=A0ABN7UMU2_GIGMA|nr:38738_t:CDS:2 [Gigaspora margarita]